MKKLLAIILVMVMIAAMACNRGGKDDGDGASAPTAEPTKELTSTPAPTKAPTQAPTPTPEPTPTPTPEPDPEPTSEPVTGTGFDAEAVGGNYQDFCNKTWFVVRGEVDGFEWEAEEALEYRTVYFGVDYSVTNVREIPDSDSDIMHGTASFSRTDGVATVSVVYDERPENSYSYTITAEGELEESAVLKYEEGVYAGAVVYYSTESWWDQDYPVGYDSRVLPEKLQNYVNKAGFNDRIVAIADPDPELSAECDEAGWDIVDETDNEWVTCPWNNPKELILINASYRTVEIEVHEPASGYDPSSEESGWEPGPFMYGAVLEPHEMCRFVVDMPENKIDATMCLYMTFEGDEFEYLLRVFKYDPDDPYITFGE